MQHIVHHEKMHRLIVLTLAIAPIAGQASGQWTQSGGPQGGALIDIVGDGASTLYGRVGGIIHRSDTLGAQWVQPKNQGLDDATAEVPQLVIGQAAFALTIHPPQNRSLFATTDGGDTWTETTITDIVPSIQDIDTFNWDGRLLALVKPWNNDPQQLLASDDLGQSWDSLTLPAEQIVHIAFQSDALIAAGAGGLHRSVDGGMSWASLSTDYPGADLFGLLAVNDQAIIVRGAFGGSLARSLDQGQSWSSYEPRGLPGQPAAVVVVGQEFFAAMGGQIYKASGDASLWTPVEVSGLPAGVEFGLLGLGGDMLLAASPQSISASTDAGASWSPVSQSFIATNIGRVGHANGVLLASTIFSPPAYRSTDGGETWTEMPFFDSTNLRCEFELDARAILVGTVSKGIFKSINGGATWTPMNSGLPIMHSNEQGQSVYEPINAIARAGNALFAATGGGNIFVPADSGHTGCCFIPSGEGVYRSVNEGASWQRVSTGLPVTAFTMDGAPLIVPITDLAVIGGAVIAVTSEGSLFRSTNMGGNWTAAGGISGVIELEIRGQQLLALTEGSLFSSVNAGQSWTLLNGRLPYADLEVLGDHLFVAGSTTSLNPVGVKRSVDGGLTWHSAGEPMDSATVTSIAAAGDVLIAGTMGQGVWIFNDQAPVTADLNADQIVNGVDLGILLSQWDGGGTADFNGDGTVNGVDLGILLAAWTSTKG